MAATGGGPATDDVPLDAEMLKVLAADSRRDILRLLQKRRMTLTELAAALDLKKATVLEHLQKLVAVGLVRRHEDERLWVYYDLTPQGGRLVTPGKTRFYLVMAGLAAAALLLGSVATVALLAPGEEHAMAVALRAEPVAGGIPLTLDLALPGDAAGVQAYLLTPAEAARLQAGDETVLRAPLPLVGAGGSVRVMTRDAVPPGDYLLYVRDADGRDNRDAMIALHLPRFEARGPAALTRGLDPAQAFTVHRDGDLADGSLLVLDGRAARATLPVAEGSATLGAAALDALPAGRYDLAFQPEGTQAQVPLGVDLQVRDATLALSPLRVAEGRPATLTLSLPGHEGPAPDVRVQGVSAPVAPAGSGTWRVSVPPLAPGSADVQVGRLHRALDVEPDLGVALRLDQGAMDLLATAPDGTPRAGVLATLDGAALGTTDAQGRLRFAPPAPRAEPALLRLRADADETVTRAVVFQEESVVEAAGRIVVADVRQAGLNATALVSNEGPAPAALTVSAYQDGRLTDALPLDLEPGAASPVRLNLTASAGKVEIRADAVRLSPLTFARGAGPARDVSGHHVTMEAPGAGNATGPVPTAPLPAAPTTTLPPTALVPATPTGLAYGGQGAPSPEVPFPWALVLVALVGAAALLRRRR